jgi:hypothetical protein
MSPPLPQGLSGPPKPPFTPVSASAYFDRIAVWLPSPAGDADLAYLRRHCGHLKRSDRPRHDSVVEKEGEGGHGQVRRRTLTAGGRLLVQRLDLAQPDEAALEWIGRRRGHINALEVAVDFAFPSRRERDLALEYIEEHLVRPRHPRGSPVRFIDYGRKPAKYQSERRLPAATRYDGGRANGVVLKVYPERFQRGDGVLDILHVEMIARDRRAVETFGVHDASDALHFDFATFWQKRFRLAHLDVEKLGRLYRNRVGGKKRRAGPDQRALDERAGSALVKRLNIIDRSGGQWAEYDHHRIPLQTIIDEYRPLRVERALVHVSVEPWLALLSH